MRASDVMTTAVITVKPEMTVRDVAKLLLEQGISGAPVIDATGETVGMITEGDLLHRAEIDTERPRRSWWLDLFLSGRDAQDYVKSHGRRVSDVMTYDVISVDEATPLNEIANLLERRRIKRVPVTRAGQLVGIISRSNLIQALASSSDEPVMNVAATDSEIRATLMGELTGQSWAFAGRNIVVSNGVVHLWGMFRSREAVEAVRVAAETTPGVKRVDDHTQDYPVLGTGF